MAADYVHLVAAVLWVGGIVMLMIIAAAARTTGGEVGRRSILLFSRLALPTVAVVALAGLGLAVREMPTPAALFSSGYGVTLLLKSAIGLGAPALGGYHRRFVVPRLQDGAPVATIRRTLTLELCLLVAALLLAAVLNQAAPPA